jgi:hypothetical protein
MRETRGASEMINARDAVVWVNFDDKEVRVTTHGWNVRHGLPGHHWRDPIGAAYSQWRAMNNEQRMRLMCETVIDLAAQGIPLKTTLVAFCEVREFRALGRESFPMSRAITWALVGRCLEPNTMTFDELLEHYACRQNEIEA